MKQYYYLTLLVCSLMILSSCEKSLEVANATEGNSLLTVQTRAESNTAKVSYPVTVYAMNSDGECIKRQQLLSDDDQLSLSLQPTTYQIYAIGGATEGDYTLPTQANATATSTVTLNSEATHGDLMTAHNTINLSDNESTTLTLTMSRKVMHLQDLVIKNVPTTVDGVAVAFTPIYDNLLLNGDYSTTSSEQTVTLTEQVDGTTWQITGDELYMLPASDDATITVKFTTGASITSFAYSCPQPLEANKHVSITGTYTGTGELTLTGTITGATWNGTTTIEFTFNSSGSTTVDSNNGGGDNNDNNDNQDNIEEGSAPAVGSIYKDYYVLNTEDDDSGDYVTVTLLHKMETQIKASEQETLEALEAEINTVLLTYDTNDITGWRLPTESEFRSISSTSVVNKAFHDSNIEDAIDMSNKWYYFSDGANIKCGSINMGISILDYTYGESLRPVTTVTFKK